jgi:hypothetical protein
MPAKDATTADSFSRHHLPGDPDASSYAIGIISTKPSGNDVDASLRKLGGPGDGVDIVTGLDHNRAKCRH